MGELLAVVLGGVLAGSFLALAVYAAAGVTCAVATLRHSRRQRELGVELDAAIEAILGPRSAVDAPAGWVKPAPRG